MLGEISAGFPEYVNAELESIDESVTGMMERASMPFLLRQLDKARDPIAYQWFLSLDPEARKFMIQMKHEFERNAAKKTQDN
mgnify:FL=1